MSNTPAPKKAYGIRREGRESRVIVPLGGAVEWILEPAAARELAHDLRAACDALDVAEARAAATATATKEPEPS
jgi:hypothetical protein